MSARTSIDELLAESSQSLERAGVENAVLDARLLLAHAMNSHPTWLFAHGEEPVPEAAAGVFTALLERRCAREPLQHLVGEQEFWSLSFSVSPDVLIPRPETEHLVEAALAAVRDIELPRLADIATGSGCVVLSLASELPTGRFVASDLSPAALACAEANATRLGLAERVSFREGDLTEALVGEEPFHAMTANLPYVTKGEWATLEPEVRDFEPKMALVGGEDGLDLVRRLVNQAPKVLVPRGWLGLEIGHQQAEETADILLSEGFTGVLSTKDFGGIDRIVEGRAPR